MPKHPASLSRASACASSAAAWVLFGAHGVSAVFVDRLRRQPQVPHDGYSGRKDAVNRFEDLFAALDLHGIGLGLLHDADGRVERHLRIALVGSERQVDDDQCTANGTHDRTRMVNHHIEGNGKRGFVTGHHVGRRVAHEDHIDTRGVDDPGHRIIVRGQHGDLLAALLHLRQTVGGHCPDSTFYRHSLLRTRWIIQHFIRSQGSGMESIGFVLRRKNADSISTIPPNLL